MRVALKIGYDGRAFFGHQRQPDRRTVEGECLSALRSARIVRDAREAFFRSASRTDRGVSAIGNVIAFDTAWGPDAVVGAFNDKARDVWAWAVAEVPASFHPRHAVERWYRYHVVDDVPIPALSEAGLAFVGTHDLRSFSSDPVGGLHTVSRIDVSRDEGLTLVDVWARSFLRGMVRRIVAAMLAHARGEVSLDEIRSALAGRKRDFGSAPPEPLVLMDLRYDLPFRIVLKPKVRDEWATAESDARLRLRLLRDLANAVRDGRPE